MLSTLPFSFLTDEKVLGLFQRNPSRWSAWRPRPCAGACSSFDQLSTLTLKSPPCCPSLSCSRRGQSPGGELPLQHRNKALLLGNVFFCLPVNGVLSGVLQLSGQRVLAADSLQDLQGAGDRRLRRGEDLPHAPTLRRRVPQQGGGHHRGGLPRETAGRRRGEAEGNRCSWRITGNRRGTGSVCAALCQTATFTHSGDPPTGSFFFFVFAF